MNTVLAHTDLRSFKRRINLEVDTHKLDIEIENTGRHKATRQDCRPYLTVMYDAHSKEVVWYTLTKHTPSAAHPLKGPPTFSSYSPTGFSEYEWLVHAEPSWFKPAFLKECFGTVSFVICLSPKKRQVERVIFYLTQALSLILRSNSYGSKPDATLKTVRLAVNSVIQSYNRDMIRSRHLAWIAASKQRSQS
ncbi:hypothetical protein [Pseudomonas shirazica]|uniref:hypothetical protein n=1 Tax=Pseudomonas shirazica TaxID=1940636 RepID=UPI00111922E6|nr:hypothetical protein [Pseudomonas shirazica]